MLSSSIRGTSASTPTQDPDNFEDNLELAIRLSRAEKLKENELLMEESKMIEMAIKLSLEER
jgi:Ubiquitin interaction motif